MTDQKQQHFPSRVGTTAFGKGLFATADLKPGAKGTALCCITVIDIMWGCSAEIRRRLREEVRGRTGAGEELRAVDTEYALLLVLLIILRCYCLVLSGSFFRFFTDSISLF